ncbi:MAG: hypothetical protein WAV90_21580, partial [Gordonia amarae]
MFATLTRRRSRVSEALQGEKMKRQERQRVGNDPMQARRDRLSDERREVDKATANAQRGAKS